MRQPKARLLAILAFSVAVLLHWKLHVLAVARTDAALARCSPGCEAYGRFGVSLDYITFRVPLTFGAGTVVLSLSALAGFVGTPVLGRAVRRVSLGVAVSILTLFALFGLSAGLWNFGLVWLPVVAVTIAALSVVPSIRRLGIASSTGASPLSDQ